MARAIGELRPGANVLGRKVHLDPDLMPESRARLPNWRPMFGQANAAEAHLRHQGVGPGDLVIFFGWFRRTERYNGRLRYLAGSPDVHVMFGWLQIEERWTLKENMRFPPWAEDHPHCKPRPYSPVDAVYIAKERLSLPGLDSRIPGGGTFGTYAPVLQLTAPAATRSHWRLPKWFLPSPAVPTLSYHRRPERWREAHDHVLLHAVGRGQEFVLPDPPIEPMVAWLRTLLQSSGDGAA